MKKQILLLTFTAILLIVGVLSCSSKECSVVPTSSYSGTVTGLSIDEHNRTWFELRNKYGDPYMARYSSTVLKIGDSIKYTTPSDTCDRGHNTDLGRIVKYN